MTMLSDISIRHALTHDRIRIEPFDKSNLQPASYDVKLGGCPIDLNGVPIMNCGDVYFLNAQQFALASTLEVVELGRDVAARLEGKSSLGRLGLCIHATAGFIDPGFRGQVTLELFNMSDRVIELRPEMLIGQLSFFQMSTAVSRAYGDPELGSHYQGQMGPTLSRHGE